MIVDDEKSFLDEFSEMLQLSGYQTESFWDAREALDQAGSIKPDLVFADLNMPEMTGIELADKIKNVLDVTRVAVVIISNSLSEEARQEVLNKSDVDQCLIKPIKPLQVINQVENLLIKKEGG